MRWKTKHTWFLVSPQAGILDVAGPWEVLGHANDIARGVVFLTADDADFITGSTLSINGGQHMY